MEFDCSKEVLTTEVVSKAYSEIWINFCGIGISKSLKNIYL
jgi:hypothetical protein